MNWRRKYRGVWTTCECGITWTYLGRRKQGGRKIRMWQRYWPGVNTSPSLWAENQFKLCEADCFAYLKRKAR